MKRSPLTSLVLFGLLAAVLIGSVVYLFRLRFSAGDIYPAYSSLRADPKGTRVLFEGLERLREVEVVRNLHPLNRIEADPETTLLLLGVNRRLPEETIEQVSRMLEEGAHVVVSYYPFQEREEPDLRRLVIRRVSDSPDDPEPARYDYTTANLAAEMGRTFGYELRYRRGAEEFRDRPLRGLQAEPAAWEAAETPDFWFSRLYLEPGDEWEVLLRVGEDPVIARRSYRNGTLILLTDTYWLSNEAMRMSRQTDFVAWVIGSPRQVVFDETHLGVMERERLSHLMRRMNLEFPIAVLLILAGLFIWKNGVAFPPREAAAASGGNNDVQGFDSQVGLVNLLRANIESFRIFPAAWEEWLKTLEPRERTRLAARIEAAEEIVKKTRVGRLREQELVNSCRQVMEILNERKRYANNEYRHRLAQGDPRPSASGDR